MHSISYCDTTLPENLEFVRRGWYPARFSHILNEPFLKNLHPYPFEKLAALKQAVNPPLEKAHIALSMGEPQHAAPDFIKAALMEHGAGFSHYPTTKGAGLRSLFPNGWLTALRLPWLYPDNQLYLLTVRAKHCLHLPNVLLMPVAYTTAHWW